MDRARVKGEAEVTFLDGLRRGPVIICTNANNAVRSILSRSYVFQIKASGATVSGSVSSLSKQFVPGMNFPCATYEGNQIHWPMIGAAVQKLDER